MLAWLGHGLSNAAIAREMRIAPSTVRNHVVMMRTKLGLSRLQLAVLAERMRGPLA